MPKLVIESGETSGRAFEFVDDIIIGRGSTPDFAIFDSKVSRQHAAIRRLGRIYVLSDLGSGNGTHLNGVRITAPMTLSDGDRLHLGNVDLEFIWEDDSEEGLETTAVRFADPNQKKASQPVLGTLDADVDVGELLASRTGGQEALEVARKRLQTIVEVSEAISETLDEPTLLTLIMEKLFELFPQAERGFIMLSDDGRDELVAQVALTRSGEPAEIAVSRTIVGDAIENRRGILSADAVGDARYANSDSIAKLNLRSVVCVPLIARGDVYGVIHLDGATKPFDQDDMALLTGIARQAAVSLVSARTHERLLKQRLTDEDLALARKIQSHFLPQQPPRVPSYVFEAVYRSALEVGGDYYDFPSLPNGQLGIALGDVSGKGVSAALCMAKLSSETRYLSGGETDPAAILRKLNASLYRDFTEGMFVSMVLFSLDAEHGRLRLANAGHLPPLLRRPDGTVEPMDTKRSPPLGVMAELDCETSSFELGPGEIVITFTDGVTEALNRNEDPFGNERLLAAVAKAEGAPEKVLTELLQSVETFLQGRPQSDDLTIVCFGRDV